ncbi:type I-E CRISPR-associated protein Cse2/CasB [Streptomyces sp. CC53]|uniref:type I-E CRISPR-associated protein Cse2/CasB n=1 Tax=Streptomyces sp. CC53 TaxID=1906740 RepID=UPI0008DD1911|nr:type I-E CRISPR-associated protein Cse2/CasB [Streptomyces sp. CC53]OII63098.1 type I-E CRISPR-associated protein Cse2/CasB [Streptomyces sp. CC53]
MTLTTGESDAPHAGGDAPALPRHDKLAFYDAFTDRVREMCANPGTQQALRMGLGRTMDEMPSRTHAALLRHGLIPERTSSVNKRAYYAVAALIAFRPRAERRADAAARQDAAARPETDDRNPDDSDTFAAADEPQARVGQRKSVWGSSFGESLAGLTARRDRPAAVADSTATVPSLQQDKISGVEQRLHLLVRQDIDGVHRMLPPLVRQLGSAGLAVDYGRLLYDLVRWPHRRDDVALRWLEDYYRTLRRAERPA